MAVELAFEEDVLMLICGYSQQSGWCLEVTQSFYDKFKNECDMHGVDDIVMFG